MLGILAIKIAHTETCPHLLPVAPWVSLVKQPQLYRSGNRSWRKEAEPLNLDVSKTSQRFPLADDGDAADTELQLFQLSSLGKHPIHEIRGQAEVMPIHTKALAAADRFHH